MHTDNIPGWQLFHRRQNGLVEFYRTWADYKAGFGSQYGEFWLGLETLHLRTESQTHSLRIEIEDWDCNVFYSEYTSFAVGPESDGYRLTITGFDPASTAGDSMENPPISPAATIANGMKFTTYDADNDLKSGNCAVSEHSAWWYNRCGASTANGRYITGGQTSTQGILWYTVYNNWYSFKRFEMKIRPNL